jgi:hypothetical protein
VTSTIRVRFEGDQIGAKFKKNLTVARDDMNASLQGAAQDYADEFLKQGRANIRIRARDYPGKLFRVNRKGGKAPLLLSAATKEPKYFAKPYVKIPKKFRVLEIARELSHKINDFYKRRMAKLRQGRR